MESDSSWWCPVKCQGAKATNWNIKPFKHKKKTSPVKVVKHWSQFPREVVESPSWGIQNLTGHDPEPPTVVDPHLSMEGGPGPFQLQPICDSALSFLSTVLFYCSWYFNGVTENCSERTCVLFHRYVFLCMPRFLYRSQCHCIFGWLCQ